ncbi:MAG: hypothetical protein ACXQTX_04375 [Candidatus Syntropharchaeia archaeon]
MRHRFEGDESIVVPARYGKLGWRKVRGYLVPFSRELGVGQYFSNLIMKRINQQKPCNVVFQGEAGISKSYSAIQLARFLQPDFSIDQVVFTYAEFQEAMIKFKEGKIIVLEEPEYVAGHRDWYQLQNKALVSTMRSGRFKVHPVFIPCINKRLLDKVVRENLLQFMVHLEDRGMATVYRFTPSRFENKTYTRELCKLRIEMLDVSKCQRQWCYSCERFKDDSCKLLRAQYEHKRQRIQDQRYREDLERAKKEQQKRKSFEEWLADAYRNKDKFYYTTSAGKQKISVDKIQLYLGCSQTMAQKIRQTLKTMTKKEVRQYILERLGLDVFA